MTIIMRCMFVLLCITQICANNNTTLFKLGVENISSSLVCWLSKRRIGLIANQTSRAQRGTKTIDILRQHNLTVHALLAPEHGIHGNLLAAQAVQDAQSSEYMLPIISVYGNGMGKHFSADMLNNIDTLIFDIQDSGMRHYTYISTLFYAIKAAVEHNKLLVVLDRPNPLGRIAEGPLVESGLHSFIAIASIPLRHGMTVGELALYFNNEHFNKKATIHVVPMSGYQDEKQYIQKCAMNLSPNIQTLDACYGYSFLGLLGEIRPFDVGIGTPFAFQCITIPQELKISGDFWISLQKLLAKQGIQSSEFTYYSTRKKKQMIGLRITIPNIHTVSTCTLLSGIISRARSNGIAITFSQEFDTAIGSRLARAAFQDTQTWNNFIQATTAQVQEFYNKVQSLYLYKSLPISIVQAETAM